MKKTNSIFVEDECYGKQEYDYHHENNNKKHLPTIVTQHHQQQQPSKSPFALMSVDRSGQQASLDIPARDDEDNKSQHSSRTMSSSRRQSTEDSIDTDDEYFCYELRKLEELERLSHLENANLSGSANEDIQQSLLSKIDALNTGSDIWYATVDSIKHSGDHAKKPNRTRCVHANCQFCMHFTVILPTGIEW